jgi:putative lipoprotein
MPRQSATRTAARRLGAAARAACVMVGFAATACLPRSRPVVAEPMDLLSVYSCGGDFQFGVRELSGVATIRVPMQTIALPRVRSATGVRYAGPAGELVKRGTTATLVIGAERHADCTGQTAASLEDAARMLGVEYRAVGREPGWSLEIDDGKYIRFLIDGSHAVHLAVPTPTGDASRRVYRASANGQELEAIIETRPCTNPASPTPFPHTVTVTYNGFPHPGCGGPVGAPD